MDTRITTQRGTPLVDQFYTPLDANWDLTTANGAFSLSGGNLIAQPPSAGASGQMVSRLGFVTGGRFNFDEVLEASRSSGCGYVLSLKSETSEIAIGLNASPTTRQPLASADAPDVFRFNSCVDGHWGTERSIVVAQPLIGRTVDYMVILHEERLALYVDGTEVLICQTPTPHPFDDIHPTVVAVASPAATALPALRIGQIEAFSYSAVHVEGGNSLALKVESPSLGKPSEAAASSDTGSFSLISLFKRLLSGMTSLIASVIQVRDDTRASYGRLRPDQKYIERWGAMNVSGTSDNLFTNAASIPVGYTPQNIEYTVPLASGGMPDQVFLLRGWRVALDAPSNSINVMATLEIGGEKKIRMSLNTNSPSQGASFEPAIPVPAGTVVRCYAHTSQGSAVTFMRFTGIQENA